MLIDAIQLLRNIGTFDSVNSGAQLQLKKFALIYAENGRGKTTLAAVLRSLGNGDPLPILERKRLRSANAPHVVVAGNGGVTAVFENGTWANQFADIVVFDDHFVAENVCSGMEVEATHRQNLHELIIGAQGVALDATLQGHKGANHGTRLRRYRAGGPGEHRRGSGLRHDRGHHRRQAHLPP